jgi:hypothetical protein
VFRIFHACGDRTAASQLWERGAVVFAGTPEIQDRVAGNASPFTVSMERNWLAEQSST